MRWKRANHNESHVSFSRRETINLTILSKSRRKMLSVSHHKPPVTTVLTGQNEEPLLQRESGRTSHSHPGKPIGTSNVLSTNLPESDRHVKGTLDVSENIVKILHRLHILNDLPTASVPTISLPSPNPSAQAHLRIVGVRHDDHLFPSRPKLGISHHHDMFESASD